jgi:transcriptional regulator with XRE-family HTH domain
MCQETAKQVIGERDGTEWIVSPPDEVHPPISGEEAGNLSALLYAPSSVEIREMLLALRLRQRWSQAFTAAVLGVTEGAVVKWESGKRKPNGAAAKLIFLLHSQIVEKADKVKNCWDLAFWGGLPCRNSLPLLAISGTYWVPDHIMREISTTPAERLRPELRRFLGLAGTSASS